jgi:D-aspartate ligase
VTAVTRQPDAAAEPPSAPPSASGFAAASSGRQDRWGRTADEIGAVVIGGDYQGMGIIRSLGRRGIPICVVDDELSIGRFSRYTTHALRVGDLRDPEYTVQTLLATGRRLGLEGWVLYPTREETVAALSRSQARLSELFRVPTGDWRAVERAWDKRKTYELAAELGIPYPRTWYPAGVAELTAIDTDPPWVVKPAIKETFLHATGAKAWRADDRAELRARFAQAAQVVGPGEVMIQELVPGDGRHQFACCAFAKDGQMLATMVARRRRQHPPEFGRASTFVETVDVPLLEEFSSRFLSAIGYCGLVELEYKLDPRTGQFKLLDVNARTWGYHSLGAAAGVDFPYLQFADQLGQTVPPCRARVGTRWIRLATDVPTAIVELWAGRLSLPAYLRSVRAADAESVFDRHDPLPGMIELALIPYLAVKRGF